MIVALLLNVEQHGEQTHNTHAGNETWRGETLLERVDRSSLGVDAETTVRVRHRFDVHVEFEIGLMVVVERV